ncbi:MAG: hypothetical protein JXA44_00775 [Methanospirillaceae archaeon]|nr:hypothetical protein [Methanospirillaceae archaeon]
MRERKSPITPSRGIFCNEKKRDTAGEEKESDVSWHYPKALSPYVSKTPEGIKWIGAILQSEYALFLRSP